ncbi:MAG: CopG family transcriptional regulator [Candidatus Hydromicrobium americanum]|nr:MAG: CopG family transcriptional regulator [Candidatus Hydromicrobium americanum]
MSKTVTLRIENTLYKKLKEHAKSENRTLSNFIETAALKYIEQIELVDEYEMKEIISNADLLERLKRGSSDVINKKGKFV